MDKIQDNKSVASSGSDDNNDEDDSLNGLEPSDFPDRGPNETPDPSLDSLAIEFGSHTLQSFGSSGMSLQEAPKSLIDEARLNVKGLVHHTSSSTSSGKRKVTKDYSGRIDNPEVTARQKKSLEGSFRIAKGKNVVKQTSVRRSQGTRDLGFADGDANANKEKKTADDQQVDNENDEDYNENEEGEEDDDDEDEASNSGGGGSGSSVSNGVTGAFAGAQHDLKKRLSMITDIGLKMKQTVIRRVSSTTSGEKIDGRSAVDRHAAKPRHWTKEEDELLRKSVALHGEKQWKKIAQLVPGRNHTQCLQRWSKVLTPGLKKGQWSVEEDQILLQLAQDQLNECDRLGKPKKVQWGVVKRGIPGRTAKQCRERWVNNLNPEIRRGDWTREEDDLILILYEIMPQKWAAIAKQLPPGRTENAVKIRWKSLTRDDPTRGKRLHLQAQQQFAAQLAQSPQKEGEENSLLPFLSRMAHQSVEQQQQQQQQATHHYHLQQQHQQQQTPPPPPPRNFPYYAEQQQHHQYDIYSQQQQGYNQQPYYANEQHQGIKTEPPYVPDTLYAPPEAAVEQQQQQQQHFPYTTDGVNPLDLLVPPVPGTAQSFERGNISPIELQQTNASRPSLKTMPMGSNRGSKSSIGSWRSYASESGQIWGNEVDTLLTEIPPQNPGAIFEQFLATPIVNPPPDDFFPSESEYHPYSQPPQQAAQPAAQQHQQHHHHQQQSQSQQSPY